MEGKVQNHFKEIFISMIAILHFIFRETDFFWILDVSDINIFKRPLIKRLSETLLISLYSVMDFL